ncbi:hypothetical protein J6590_071089 [Homalodisca vitripennis]|nr:hypothetical protein J6590_071089 [Homalodisca vitripennis]
MNLQLILVVLLNQKADRYSATKKKSLVDKAVPTQVLLAKNLNKEGVMSIATKVAIQMNCKIGGAPWSMQMPLGGHTVVGFDVCHDARSKGKSYGDIVASLNEAMTHYFSAVSHHTTGEESSNDLALNVVKALHCYKRHNKILPSHIIIYRDGVGDGQIPYVFSHEVQHVARAVQEIYRGPVKLAVVLVTEKINTRLFNISQNPRPGVGSTHSGSYILRMSQHRTAVFDKSFHVMACRLWNALPQTITSIDRHSQFVAKLKDMYLEWLDEAGPEVNEITERIDNYDKIDDIDLETSLTVAAEAGSPLLADNIKICKAYKKETRTC